ATRVAAQNAYRIAGITAKDISVAEVHDNFTVSGIMALQDLGFFERGKAGKAVLDGECRIGGKIAINTSGGLKARGHPIGATGVAQIVEIAEQLRGSADQRQVANAKYGLAQSVGGIGSAVTVSIMEAI
ncbi:MAG: thiolase domain-containing protein, partial [Candidatus Methanomethylophilaceae archaeon]|nr:thiolase domain-containing protein [Candidatus Methanomethylophilaceae archaeon]